MSILAVQFQTFSTAPPSIWAPGLIGRYSLISLRHVTLPNQFVFSLLGVVAYVQTMLRGYAQATVIVEEVILVAPEQLGIGTLTMSRFNQPCSTRRMKIRKGTVYTHRMYCVLATVNADLRRFSSTSGHVYPIISRQTSPRKVMSVA